MKLSQSAKKTKRIHKTHKQSVPKTGGYVNGQTIIFLLLVSGAITIPVGFAFYMPDPVLRVWKKNDDKLKNKVLLKKISPLNRRGIRTHQLKYK